MFLAAGEVIGNMRAPASAASRPGAGVSARHSASMSSSRLHCFWPSRRAGRSVSGRQRYRRCLDPATVRSGKQITYAGGAGPARAFGRYAVQTGGPKSGAGIHRIADGQANHGGKRHGPGDASPSLPGAGRSAQPPRRARRWGSWHLPSGSSSSAISRRWSRFISGKQR